ncbi:sodium:solute symporter family protein [Cellulomonas sp. ATA003]|uniref:sodium:solute symporter family protein n=1 Tax=Cellulomonas sp. ATA003 TaxID=3073064 RepID=UPI0028735A78|nr:sodium:solute symporter family protein [Cellulomonas sp. ATA003]WNB86532.1 sodium:solute symporter family protein [Cellulomonas sp. ATA003]
MTAVGAWAVGLALGYTLLLVVLGRRAGRAGQAREGFFVGGRSFSRWTVAFCITGLFSGSSFIAITELSYRTGISAVWYGVAETVQILLIALLLVAPLRRRLVVTVSGLIGDRFGRGPRALAGAITAVTFPMWSVATAIAFASALHAFTGLSIQLAVVFTAVLLLAYLWAGGMRSVALTQTANCVVFALMLSIGAVAILARPGWSGLTTALADAPELASWSNAGSPLIIAWFGTFVVNVILAQAAFQMSLSCRTPEEGRQGLFIAAGFGLPFIILGVGLGVAAAIVVPGQDLGLVAIPLYIAEVVPAPVAGVFVLGIWACALGWGAPCQFSGATSLGRDVGSAIRPRASEADLVRWTRWSLVALTVLMIVFGFLRTEQSAWWNVLAWTLRNGSTLAPVVAALFWPLATRTAVYAALTSGFVTGLTWYHLGGWQPTGFFSGVHPVWVGMGVNLAVLVTLTLVGTRSRQAITTDARRRAVAGAALTAAIGVAAVLAVAWQWVHPRGVSGLGLFVVVVLLATVAIAAVRERTPGQVAASDTPDAAGARRPTSVSARA